jgi:Bacterial Ig domain
MAAESPRRLSRLAVATLAVATVGGAGLATASPSAAGILPVAVNDSYSVVHERMKVVAAPGVLGNDLQLGSGFTADLVSNVDNGNLDLDANGGFKYTPKNGYMGTDSFKYRVDGGLLGLSNVATVTINVTNTPPVAKPDSYTAIADHEKTVAAPGVLGNDDDADGDFMLMDVVQEPAHGNLNEQSDGGFRYKADAGFSGTDTWRYRVTDRFSWSNTVTVTMTVSDPSSTPRPTPTATPRPSPTATPTPTPRPTSIPIPTIIPLPTDIPLPTILPTPKPSASPTDRPTSMPTPRPTPSDGSAPTPTSTSTVGQPGAGSSGGGSAPGGPVASHGSGPSGPPASGGPASSRPVDAFVVPAAEHAPEIALDAGDASFGGFEWAVPALVLTVPGILIVLAVLLQAAIGLFWLPVIRRWLAGDRRRRAGIARLSAR